MIYDLTNPLDRERYKRRCNALYEKRGIAELSDRTSRSKSQNRYLHTLLGYLAMETGNEMEYVKEVFYKRSANSDLYVREKDDAVLGKVEYLRSSASLSKEEFSLSIDRLRDWSSKVAGIYLPAPDEESLLNSIDIELSKMERWI